MKKSQKKVFYPSDFMTGNIWDLTSINRYWATTLRRTEFKVTHLTELSIVRNLGKGWFFIASRLLSKFILQTSFLALNSKDSNEERIRMHNKIHFPKNGQKPKEYTTNYILSYNSINSQILV